MRRVDFFTSHEGLLLPSEAAQTRQVPHKAGWWDLSTHLPWIGYRTAVPGEAHVEFFRGIRNPVGVKVGPDTSPQRLIDLLAVLNPGDEPGKIVIIHRFGAHARTTVDSRVLLGIENFSMCRREASYVAHPNWQVGFSVVCMEPASGQFQWYPVAISRGGPRWGHGEYSL